MTCKTHPDAPHGFDRNASHSQDRYVCECESWEPPEQTKPMGVSCPRCGKTGLQPDSIHTCTPLALRLADILGCSALQCDVDAAAELRRLHAENIELAAKVRVAESGFHAAVQTAKWQESTNSELNRHIAQKAELRAENEALREFAEEVRRTGDTRLASMAIAALARAGEMK